MIIIIIILPCLLYPGEATPAAIDHCLLDPTDGYDRALFFSSRSSVENYNLPLDLLFFRLCSTSCLVGKILKYPVVNGWLDGCCWLMTSMKGSPHFPRVSKGQAF